MPRETVDWQGPPEPWMVCPHRFRRYFGPVLICSLCGATTMVLSVIESGRFQILCANCNWIKRAERGENSKGRPRLQHPAYLPEAGL